MISKKLGTRPSFFEFFFSIHSKHVKKVTYYFTQTTPVVYSLGPFSEGATDCTE